MRVKGIIIISVLCFGIAPAHAACTNLAADFSYSKSKSCGLPVVVTFTNTSSGANQNIADYYWYLDTALVKKTTGKGGFSYTISAPGSYTFKLIAKDTGKTGCLDSLSRTIVISAVVPGIKDGNGNFSYSPVWENCISNFGAPDTFGLLIEISDSLKNYSIDFGDGSALKKDSLLLKSQSIYHKYNTLGQYEVVIIAKNGNCTDTLKGLVVNERNPVSGLIGPPSGSTSGCAPVRVRFINNSTKSSPSSKFTWEMGDGSIIVQPSSTYKDTFYYTFKKYVCNGVVKLTMNNACGSSFSTWNPIMASTKDSAIIKPTNPNNCDLSKDFLFGNISQNRFCSSPNPKKYTWNFGDGSPIINTSSTATIAKKYNRRGTFTITLIDSNTCGKDTTRFFLKIDSLPTMKMRATNIAGCAPLQTLFIDSSINVATRIWNFGDSTKTDSTPNPTHIYKTGGNFKATLSIGNVCGTLKDSIPIIVKHRIKSGIEPIPKNRCIPFFADFVNTSVIPYPAKTTFKWIFEDGSTSTLKTPATRLYTTSGNHLVTLVAYDSCGSDTARITVHVLPRPTVNLSIVSSAVCNNSSVVLRFVSDYNTSKVTWDHGDGKTPKFFSGFITEDHSYKFDSAKTYLNSAIIVDANGCRDTELLSVKVNPPPTAAYNTDKSAGCAPLSVKFTNNSIHNGTGSFSQIQFLWNYDKTKSTAVDSALIYPASKTKDSVYNVKLVAKNAYGCMDSIVKPIRVYPKPLSRFQLNTNNGCGPLNIVTKNTSIPRDTGSIYIMKFIWNLGNGQTAYRKDTQTTYAASKTKDSVYNISLIAFSEHYCIDTSYQSIRVYPKPRASFTSSPDNGCRPLTVRFNNTSIPYDTGNISIMRFYWDLGHQVVTSMTHPATEYKDVATRDTIYKVRLTAYSEHNCVDTTSRIITLHPTPVMKFAVSQSQGCTPLKVSFQNQSINATAYSWKFGANTTDFTQNPVRILKGKYLYDSIVNVQLTGVSAYGCKSDTAKGMITLFGLPKSEFYTAKDTVCYYNPVQFYNQTLGAVSHIWRFGDGSNSIVLNPLHSYQRNSNPFRDTTYKVSLISNSFKGCKDTFSKPVTIYRYTIPSLTADKISGCAPLKVSFRNTSVNAPKFSWNFGDGYNSTAANPVHIFENLELKDTAFHAVLSTWSPYCADTAGVWIRVFGRSQSLFTAGRVEPCDSGYFQFTDFSINVNTISYRFSDGSWSSQKNPTHLYLPSPYRDTSYKTALITTSANGCSDTFNRTVTLPQRLQMGMRDSAFVLCNPGLVTFKNMCIGAINSIWDFGDNTISVQRDPLHEYRKPGIYYYKLFAFDGNGCLDSITSTKTITIYDNPLANFLVTPGSGRMPSQTSISFTNTSVSAVPLNYLWNFSDPTGVPPLSVQKDVTHIFSDSGNYNICLQVTNGACSDTFCRMIRIEPHYPIPAFTSDVDSGCPPLVVQFTNQSQYGATYEWYFGDGKMSTDVNPVHTYSYAGIFNVLLVAKGPGGQVSEEKKFMIKAFGKPFSLFQVSPKILYLPEARFFTQNNSAGAMQQFWTVSKKSSNEITHTSQQSNPDFVLTDTGYYDVELITINSNGCTDTMLISNAVYVNPMGIIHVPDAFTPTGDGKNELFKPSTFNVQNEDYLFQIYNRWGEMVFETTNRDAGWDGTKQGLMCTNGVYVFKINARLTNGSEVVREGVVHLMR